MAKCHLSQSPHVSQEAGCWGRAEKSQAALHGNIYDHCTRLDKDPLKTNMAILKTNKQKQNTYMTIKVPIGKSVSRGKVSMSLFTWLRASSRDSCSCSQAGGSSTLKKTYKRPKTTTRNMISALFINHICEGIHVLPL